MNRYTAIKKVSLFGIIGNIFLLIIKMTIGILSKSQAMIADAANSAGDIFASLMSSIGNKISNEPQDDSHNFGHGKAEYIFSFLIALSMILVSFKLLYDSIISLLNPAPVAYANLLIIICVITISVKLFLFLYSRSAYKKHNSILIKATMKDHRNDCIVTTFTLLSVILNIFGIYSFDGLVGIGISIWICFTGVKIFLESYDVLMDASIDEETRNEIINIINEFSEIQKIDHLTSKPVGYKYLISVSIYLDGNMSTFESHEIADKLEKKLNSLEQVYLSIIHVNPIISENAINKEDENS